MTKIEKAIGNSEVRTPANLQELPTSSLTPNPRNARTHSAKQVAQIAASIREFGFNNPVLIDKENVVIAGHGRLLAAKSLGLKKVPILRIEHLSPARLRAYVIADNKLALEAGWDEDLLAAELGDLMTIKLDFDLAVTGFEWPEIDIILAENEEPGEEALEESPPLAANAVTAPGDVWEIGSHRLFCGDATQDASYVALLAGERAQKVFSDPPYNVPIDGHVSGLGKVKHREFAMASGEMSSPEFVDFLARAFNCLANHSADGSLHYHCMDWRHMAEILAAGSSAYAELKNLCVWKKTNGGMGSLYRLQHELVFVFKSGTGGHINNVELGKFGRYRTNVWEYAGVNSFGKKRDEELAMHPTVKPVTMIYDAILDASRPGGIVLDVFAGSGSTLVAAEKARRRGFGIELDPRYCDVILRRLRKFMGIDPVKQETGLRFTECEAKQKDAA